MDHLSIITLLRLCPLSEYFAQDERQLNKNKLAKRKAMAYAVKIYHKWKSGTAMKIINEHGSLSEESLNSSRQLAQKIFESPRQ
mmetsp:Transcript_7285/g.10249  ORF Transcript_7285/g.10249 Transcript_7285/m.10249 type:complete len:84 (+) Transcript_7285:17-268(+)